VLFIKVHLFSCPTCFSYSCKQWGWGCNFKSDGELHCELPRFVIGSPNRRQPNGEVIRSHLVSTAFDILECLCPTLAYNNKKKEAWAHTALGKWLSSGKVINGRGMRSILKSLSLTCCNLRQKCFWNTSCTWGDVYVGTRIKFPESLAGYRQFPRNTDAFTRSETITRLRWWHIKNLQSVYLKARMLFRWFDNNINTMNLCVK